MRHSLYTIIFIICLFPTTSCAQRSIYETLWKAEEYFTDPQIVALCKAIEREDLAEMERLVQAGANVNARGKDGMTPLLWAYPAGEKALEKVLELGADPNTQYDSGFRSNGMIDAGDSLLFIAMKSTAPMNTQYVEKFQNYVDILLKHGADPNLVQKKLKTVPLYNAIRFQNTDATKKLIQSGVDVDWKDDTDTSLVAYAARVRSYAVLRLLLYSGADYRTINNNGLTVALILASNYRFMQDNSELGHQYREIVAWFEKRGISIERAKEQREQWEKWDTSSGTKEAIARFIAEVSGPEVEKWLPPGVDPDAKDPDVAPNPVPPVPQNKAWNPLPVIVVIVLLLLGGGFWLWKQKRNNIP